MGRLSIYIGKDYKALHAPGKYFDGHYNPRWLDDEFVRDIIFTIDGSKVNGDYSIISPVLGNISPFMLSTGCKVCILLYMLPDKQVLIDLVNVGQNCMYFISKILENKDLTMTTTTSMSTFSGLPVHGICENDGEEFTTWMGYANKLMEYIDDYPERNIPVFKSDFERRLNGFYTKEESEQIINELRNAKREQDIFS